MDHPFLTDSFAPCPADLLTAARKAGPVRMLVVQAAAPLPMQSAFEAHQAGIANPILIGDKAKIIAEADKLSWDMSAIEIIEPDDTGEQGCAAAAVAVLQTRGVVSAENQHGIGAILKGQLHTDVFMGALLHRDAGVRIGNRLVHVFAIYPENGPPILVSDAAVNVTPDIKSQQQSLIEMQRLIEALDHGPARIAVLSATETPIESVPSSIAAGELAGWAKANLNNAEISGPLSLDLALSASSVAIKGLTGDQVAGHANALHVPDLVSGNILYKSLVYFGGGCAAGLVMGGALPILLTSRADPPAARLASVALAAILQN
ncbi:MAG: phosphate acyltransferase [Candidatus Puniceispirillaceae bacterium]